MRKKWLWILAAAAVLLLYPMIRVGIAATSLQSATAKLSNIQQLFSQPELEQTQFETALAAFSADLLTANNSANDPLLTPYKWLPVIGADFDALGKVTSTGSELVVAAQALATDGYALKSQQEGAGIQPQTINLLRDHFNEFGNASASAQVTLDSIDPGSLHFGLAEKIDRVQQAIDRVNPAIQEMTPLVNIMSGMLGNSEPQRWFIATQNLAEARGTGGIIGSYAIVSTSGGKAKLVDSGSDVKLAKLGPVSSPLMTSDYAAFWGTDPKIWQDLNAGGQVPTAGQIVVDSWKAATGEDLSGTVFLGQGTMAHLLALTGPVTVQGRTLDWTTAPTYLAKGIYADHSDVSAKNKFVSDFAKVTFKKLLTAKLDLRGLLASAAKPATGDKPWIYSTNADQQRKFVELGVAGAIGQNAGSRIWLTLNNAAGNKLEAFQHVTAVYQLGACGTENINGLPSRDASLTVKVTNRAPASGLPPYTSTRLDNAAGPDYIRGSNRELVSVYAPTGATDTGIFVNGKQEFAHFGMDG
ncbi:MAG: DUF4012 domain-containing protein, partial [Micrococcales bacterium]